MSKKDDLLTASNSYLVQTLAMKAHHEIIGPARKASDMVQGTDNKAALLTRCAVSTAIYAAVELGNGGMTRGAAMLAIRGLLLEVFDDATRELDGSNG